MPQVFQKPARVAFLAALLLTAPLRLSASPEGLEPAFRLPIGGKALAGPLVDSSREPAAAWLLSEDRNLYLLAETGALLAKIALPARPEPFLALDSGGRALLVYAEGGGQASLVAYTRNGVEAYRALLEERPAYPPSLGSDGRLFLALSHKLVCLSAAGGRLWSLDLSSVPSAPPGVDGKGRPALGLSDGSLLVASPYGEALLRIACGAAVTALAPLPGPDASLAAGLSDGRVLLLGTEGSKAAEAGLGAGRIEALAAGPQGRLYALSSGGGLSAFGLGAAPRPLWKVESGLSGAGLFLYSDRLLLTARGAAKSYSLGGEELASASFRNSSGPSAPSPAGLLFSPGEDWILGAYRFSPALGPAFGPATEAYARPSGAAGEALLFDPAIGDSSRQLSLLSSIDAKLSRGELGAGEPEAAALAAAMAEGRFDPSYPEAERHLRANPLPRARAAWLLGRIGSPDNIDALLSLLEGDADPSVKSAAVGALAAIGLDPAGKVGAAFERLVAGSRSRLDEELALSLVSAIEDLSLRSGAAPNLGSVRALLSLASRSYPASVRDRAGRALARIAGAIGP